MSYAYYASLVPPKIRYCHLVLASKSSLVLGIRFKKDQITLTGLVTGNFFIFVQKKVEKRKIQPLYAVKNYFTDRPILCFFYLVVVLRTAHWLRFTYIFYVAKIKKT